MQLTERQARILRVIVEIYVSSARPVGSAAVVAGAGLGVSSATVRNEMAVLEALGYIHQLHTSGGRVPTESGYRYYVERLMEPARLTAWEARNIRFEFQRTHAELQEWLRLAASIIAREMHNVGLITAPRSLDVRLRHVEVIAIQPAVALVIVVLQDGSVLREMLSLTEDRSQEELSALTDRLNLQLRGLTASDVEARAQGLPGLDGTVAAVTAHLLRRSEEEHAQVFHAGLSDMIRQPEFVGPRHGESVVLANERLGHMVDFLQQGIALERLLANLRSGAGVQVVIGSETSIPELQDYSFVLGQYGRGDDAGGYLGVVGPIRMQYPRAVALVQYMTDVIADILHPY